MTIGIYKITNLQNNKSYIGKSINIERRWQAHKSLSEWKRYENKTLYRAFKKYGLNNFSFEIIEKCSEEELNEKEQYYIKYYDSLNNGYNETEGGDGGKTFKNYRKRFGLLTEEEVRYIRQRWLECRYPGALVYEKEFKDKISERGFRAIWNGSNSLDIMGDIYTEENKKKHLHLEREHSGVLRRRISLEELRECRKQIAQGKPCQTLWREKYQNIYSKGGFRDLIKNSYLDERIDFDAPLFPLWAPLPQRFQQHSSNR